MTLTWATDGAGKRTSSSKGHVITAARLQSGRVFYNAWSNQPELPLTRHLEGGFDTEGLAKCKEACERHHQQLQSAVPICDSVSLLQTTSSEGQPDGSAKRRGQK